MKKIKDVLSFEFLVIVKSKSFLFTTILLVIIGIVINGAMARYMSPQPTPQTGEKSRAAFIDAADAYDETLLALYFPEIVWVRYDYAQYDEALNLVATRELLYAVRFTGGLAYDFITNEPSGETINQLNEMVKSIYQKKLLAAAGLTERTAEEILTVEVAPQIIFAADRENSEDFNIAGYYLMLAVLTGCFLQVILYGKYIATSVVNEKASRTIEILFTCAKPTEIIFGKVFGVGLAVLAQAGLVAASFYLTALFLKSPAIARLASGEASLISMVTYLYVFIFFMLAYFSYSFLFAGFGAISKEPQDVNIITVVPSLLCGIGFYTAIFGVVFAMNGMGGNVLQICSFTPFISPLIMIARVCLTSIPFYELLLAIIIDLATLIFAGIVSARIYRKYIMMYGQRFSLRALFSR